MRYLILDTNTWIYLANSQDPSTANFNEGLHFKLLETLVNMFYNGDICILYNSIIEEEWVRNKEHTEALIKKYQNQLASNTKLLKKMQKDSSSILKTEYEKILREYEAYIEARINENRKHISDVDKLLYSSIKFNISERAELLATKQALAKKAPFIGDKKNSMADAVILFSAIEFVSNNLMEHVLGKMNTEVLFVTGNKGDFSHPHIPDSIHDDLKPFIDQVGMKYYRSLMPALNQIKESVFKEEEQWRMEAELELQFNASHNLCKICSVDDESDLPVILFSELIEIENELDYPDPNQLKLLFNDEIAELIEEPYITTTQIGFCSHCSTLHLKCQACDEITAIDPDFSGFECDGCGLLYQTFWDEYGNEEIKIVEELIED